MCDGEIFLDSKGNMRMKFFLFRSSGLYVHKRCQNEFIISGAFSSYFISDRMGASLIARLKIEFEKELKYWYVTCACIRGID